MKDILGCESIDRELCYWLAREGVTERMLKLSASGDVSSGRAVVVLLISHQLWLLAEDDPELSGEQAKKLWSLPEHWVRLHGISKTDNAAFEIKIFNMGRVQTRLLPMAAWGRIVH